AIWRPHTEGRILSFRVHPTQFPFDGQNVVRGTNRPDTWTNIWISEPSLPLPAWIELAWDTPRRFNTVQVTFDTNMSHRVTLPLFRYPDCVRDYDLEIAPPGSPRRSATA